MGTVAKALDLLELFTRARASIGLSELARLSGVNKATCHRLMTELQRAGLVEQVESTREYRIGPGVLRLAALRDATVPFKDAVQPLIGELAERTGESAHVSMLVGERVEMVHYAYSNSHGLRVSLDDADYLPFHATSSGLAILAHLPVAFQDRVLSGDLPAVTPDTETDPERLRAELAEICRQGYCESAGTFEAEVHTIAFPLTGPEGDCTGAIAVAAPSSRMTPDLRARCLDALSATADEIERRWGGKHAAPERTRAVPAPTEVMK